VVPLNAYSPKGKDCTAIPGVADVSCLGGGCAVRRCLNGLVPALDGSSCVRSALEHSHQYSQSENDVEVYDDAEIYGLEHVPLERL
jgi:hypothetical protein